MKEIILKENQSERKCYIDDLPIKDLIPKEQIEIFITALAREIEEIIRTKEKRNPAPYKRGSGQYRKEALYLL